MILVLIAWLVLAVLGWMLVRGGSVKPTPPMDGRSSDDVTGEKQTERTAV